MWNFWSLFLTKLPNLKQEKRKVWWISVFLLGKIHLTFISPFCFSTLINIRGPWKPHLCSFSFHCFCSCETYWGLNKAIGLLYILKPVLDIFWMLEHVSALQWVLSAFFHPWPPGSGQCLGKGTWPSSHSATSARVICTKEILLVF